MGHRELEEILGEDLYNQVMEKVGEDTTLAIVDANEPMIPKHRLDKVISERNQLKEVIAERDRQLTDLKGGAGDTDTLKQQIAELQAKNKATAEEYEGRLQQQRFSTALERAAVKAQARNPRAVISLMDTSKLTLDGDELVGADEQIAALKQSDPYLFGVELKGRVPQGAGAKPPAPNNPWKKETWNLTEQGRIFRENPDLAARFKREAGK